MLLPLGLGGIVVGVIYNTFATVNPVWAGSLQTLLLIVLAIVTYLTNRNVKTAQGQNEAIHEKVQEVHDTTTEIQSSAWKAQVNATHAASAAAAAAAAARDSSRIVKEVGGMFRTLRDPATGATEPTGQEGGS